MFFLDVYFPKPIIDKLKYWPHNTATLQLKRINSNCSCRKKHPVHSCNLKVPKIINVLAGLSYLKNALFE
jgi:hypothetical protein